MYRYRATQVAARLLRAFPTCPEDLVERTVDQLSGWINQEDLPTYIHVSCVEALGRSEKKQAVDLLTTLLNQHEYFRIREAAAKALGEIGSPLAVEAVSHLIQALSDEDVREAAAEALAKIGSPQAIETLIHALLDKQQHVRGFIAQALGKIGSLQAIRALIKSLLYEDHTNDDMISRYRVGRSSDVLGKIGVPAIQHLIQALSDENKWIRRGTAEALGNIGSPKAVPYLIQALSDDEDAYVREAVAEALGKIGELRAVQPLIQALSDGNWWMRQKVAEALGNIGSPLAVQPLIQVLWEGNEWMRDNAAEALGKIGDPLAVQPLIQALSDGNWWIRQEAAEALGEIDDSQSVPHLIKALSDEKWLVRQAAAEALGKIGGPQTIETLIQALSNDENEDMRSIVAAFLQEFHFRLGVVAEALEKIGYPLAIQLLIQALSWVFQSAAKVVGRVGSPQTIETLIQVLSNDENEDSRSIFAEVIRQRGLLISPQAIDALLQEFDFTLGVVAEALGMIGSPQALPVLIPALSDQQCKYLRKSAAKALGEIGDSQAVQPLIQALADKDKWVREAAAEALGKIGSPSTVPYLIQALSDKEEWVPVRSAAAQALDKIGSPLPIQPLIQALSDDDRDVRKHAAKALGKIGQPAILTLIEALKDSNNEQYFVIQEILWGIHEKVRYPDFYKAAHPEKISDYWYLLDHLPAIFHQLTPPANKILLPVSLKGLEGILPERQRVDELYNMIFMELDWDMATTVDSIQSLAKAIYSKVRLLDQQLMIIFYELDPDDSLIRLVKHLVSRRVKIGWITNKSLPDPLTGFSLCWGEKKLLEDIQQWINNDQLKEVNRV